MPVKALACTHALGVVCLFCLGAMRALRRENKAQPSRLSQSQIVNCGSPRIQVPFFLVFDIAPPTVPKVHSLPILPGVERYCACFVNADTWLTLVMIYTSK